MKTKSFFDYILLIYLIAISGFSSFFTYIESIYYISPLILFSVYYRKLAIPKKVLISLSLLFLLFLIQTFIHNGSYTIPFSQTYQMFIISLSAILLAERFYIIFPKIMYFISLISVFLWISCIIFPDFKSLLISISNFLPETRSADFLENTTNPSYSLYIYTISVLDNIRNSGPFWEPGMFSVFITIALMINLFNGKKFLIKENIILLIANISTFSTTGYIATSILIISYIFLTKQNLYLKTVIILILPLFIYQFFNLDFIIEKISHDYYNRHLAYSRFGAMYYHIEKIKLSPIFGYGFNSWPQTPMDFLISDRTVTPNGISLIVVKYGIPFSLFYFFKIFNGISLYINSKYRWIKTISFIILIILVFSQDISNRFFYILLFMFGLLVINKKSYDS